jgi:hypothetical protein
LNRLASASKSSSSTGSGVYGGAAEPFSGVCCDGGIPEALSLGSHELPSIGGLLVDSAAD